MNHSHIAQIILAGLGFGIAFLFVIYVIAFFPPKLDRPVLPEEGVFDKVTLDCPELGLTRKGVLARHRCKHTHSQGFQRVDYRWSTPDFADVYRGMVCIDCGTIISERQVF